MEEQLWYFLTYSLGDKEIHTFSKGISLNVDIILRLELELAYFEAVVQHFCHYTMGTHLTFVELKFRQEKWYKGEFDIGWNNIKTDYYFILL